LASKPILIDPQPKSRLLFIPNRECSIISLNKSKFDISSIPATKKE
jgi:hypothetical protein